MRELTRAEPAAAAESKKWIPGQRCRVKGKKVWKSMVRTGNCYFQLSLEMSRVGSIKCCNGEDGVRSQVLMDLLWTMWWGLNPFCKKQRSTRGLPGSLKVRAASYLHKCKGRKEVAMLGLDWRSETSFHTAAVAKEMGIPWLHWGSVVPWLHYRRHIDSSGK
jgi:hypothetical protein